MRVKPWLRHIGIAVMILATVYFGWYVVDNWAVFPRFVLSASKLGYLLVATAVYLTTMVLGVFSWYLLLKEAKVTVSAKKTAAIFLISQFAKYIPGNVAQHIGRVVLARSYGLDIPRVIMTMTLETGWVVFTAALIAVVALLTGAPAVFDFSPLVPATWQIVFIGISAAIAPFAGLWLFNRLRPGLLSRIIGGREIKIPPARVMVLCFAIYAFNFLLMGAVLYLLASQLFGQASADFWFLTGVFAVAWIAGFLTPGAPGGLGVREAILVAALGPIYGAGTALALTVILRGVTVAGDGLGFLAGLVARHFAGRPSGG